MCLETFFWLLFNAFKKNTISDTREANSLNLVLFDIYEVRLLSKMMYCELST